MKLSDISRNGKIDQKIQQWFRPSDSFPAWTILLRKPNATELTRNELTELWTGFHTLTKQDVIWAWFQYHYRVLGTITGPEENSIENRIALAEMCKPVLRLSQLKPLLKEKALTGKTEFQPCDVIAQTTRYNRHNVYVWFGGQEWGESILHFSMKLSPTNQ